MKADLAKRFYLFNFKRFFTTTSSQVIQPSLYALRLFQGVKVAEDTVKGRVVCSLPWWRVIGGEFGILSNYMLKLTFLSLPTRCADLNTKREGMFPQRNWKLKFMLFGVRNKFLYLSIFHQNKYLAHL